MEQLILYNYQGNPVEELPYFLYEVSLYKIEKNRANILCSKYYSSDKLLNVKEIEVIKRFKNYTLERFITLLGVPLEFIKENNLSIYEKRTR